MSSSLSKVLGRLSCFHTKNHKNHHNWLGATWGATGGAGAGGVPGPLVPSSLKSAETELLIVGLWVLEICDTQLY